MTIPIKVSLKFEPFNLFLKKLIILCLIFVSLNFNLPNSSLCLSVNFYRNISMREMFSFLIRQKQEQQKKNQNNKKMSHVIGIPTQLVQHLRQASTDVTQRNLINCFIVPD